MGLEYCLNSTLVYAPCYDEDKKELGGWFLFGLQPAANQEEHGDNGKQVGAREASQKAEEQQSADASGCRTPENDPAAVHPKFGRTSFSRGIVVLLRLTKKLSFNFFRLLRRVD